MGIKRKTCLLLSLMMLFSFGFGSYTICYANTGVKVTSQMLNKIAFPYNVFIRNGEWELVDYDENIDGSLYYVVKMADGLVSEIHQSEINGELIFDIREGEITNLVAISEDGSVSIDGESVNIEFEEVEVNLNPQMREYIEYRESEPYYGSPRMYTDILGENNYNKQFADCLSSMAESAFMAALVYLIPGIALYVEYANFAADTIKFIKDTYEMNDPNTYAIHAIDYKIGLEDPPAVGGYFKRETVFYFDRAHREFAYATHLWGKVLS